MKNDETTAVVQAAWVQAIGSVLAVLAAVMVALWGGRSRKLDREKERDERAKVENRRTRIYQDNLISSLEALSQTAADMASTIRYKFGMIGQSQVDLHLTIIPKESAHNIYQLLSMSGVAASTGDEESAHRLDDRSLSRMQAVWRKCQKYITTHNELYSMTNDDLVEKCKGVIPRLLSLLDDISLLALTASTSIRAELERNERAVQKS